MELTRITGDIVFRGEISFDGKLDVEGQVFGRIESEGNIQLHESGFIKGDIFVKNAVVKGKIQGNLTSDSLTIHSGGNVHGDIECRQLQIEKGGVHNGVSIMK